MVGGLKNGGRRCYANSIIQALAAVPEIQKYSKMKLDGQSSPASELFKIIETLNDGNDTDAIKLINFFGWDPKQNHDASEFFWFLAQKCDVISDIFGITWRNGFTKCEQMITVGANASLEKSFELTESVFILPENLFFSLNRAEETLLDDFSFPLEIDAGKIFTDRSQIFNLTAIVLYSAKILHYKTVRKQNGFWVECNDKFVKLIDINTMKSWFGGSAFVARCLIYSASDTSSSSS